MDPWSIGVIGLFVFIIGVTLIKTPKGAGRRFRQGIGVVLALVAAALFVSLVPI